MRSDKENRTLRTNRVSDLISSLGTYSPGEHRLACPECAKGKTDQALAVRVDPDGCGRFLCHRCGFKGGFGGDLSRQVAPQVRRMPVGSTSRAALRDAADLWASSIEISPEDPAGTYLIARGCSLPPAGSDLRWLAHHRHPCGWSGPCLMARATDAITGEVRTWHRTWIDPDKPGTKARVERPRLLWAKLPKLGAVVRLWPDWSVTTGLAIGEGIENCLVAGQGRTPIWAALDAGNLAAFPVLDGIEALTIVADHDRPDRQGRRAGLSAADDCAARWVAAGREARIWASPVEGEDAADFARMAA